MIFFNPAIVIYVLELVILAKVWFCVFFFLVCFDFIMMLFLPSVLNEFVELFCE